MPEGVGARRSSTLGRRLVTWYAMTVLIVLIGVGVGVDRLLADQVRRLLTDSLERQAVTIAALAEPDGLQSMASRLGEETGLRVTFIDIEGAVLADSDADAAAPEDHSTREEVREAMQGEAGSAERESEITGAAYLYLALPPRDGLIVRVALPLDEVQASLDRSRVGMVLVGLAVAAVGLVVVWLVARRLVAPIEKLTASVDRIAEGDLETRVPPSRLVEVERLGSAFNHMAEQLGARLKEADQERARRDLVLASLDSGVILIEPDDTVAYANKAAADLIGSTPEVLSRLVPHPLQPLVRVARQSGEPATDEIRHGRPEQVFEVSAVPLDADGGVLLAIRNVTERRRIEAMRYSFVADASHELKTPVAAIQAAMETVQKAIDRDPATAKRLAAGAESSAARLGRIVGDLLDLSRLETEQISPEDVELSGLVAEVLDRAAPLAGERGVTLESSLHPVKVSGQQSDLVLAVRNLVENAIGYTDRGGKVTVGLDEVDGGALLEVEDTGIGIPTRELPRIFERFYRVDASRSRNTGGTGLGLSIVRHVAQRHGGRIEVESELGSGSVFRLFISSGGAAG
ncbi:MAG TPA: ATP-binding protein [Acidimicrobiia bacterium]|nr:ATP-binding protein [Acidimicrobiia bacterium]